MTNSKQPKCWIRNWSKTKIVNAAVAECRFNWNLKPSYFGKLRFSFLVSDNILLVKQFLSPFVPEKRLYFSEKAELEVVSTCSVRHLLEFSYVIEETNTNLLQAKLKLQVEDCQKIDFLNNFLFYFTSKSSVVLKRLCLLIRFSETVCDPTVP